jgi:hypothetical protein
MGDRKPADKLCFFMAPEKIGKADWSYLYTYGTCRTACQGRLLI